MLMQSLILSALQVEILLEGLDDKAVRTRSSFREGHYNDTVPGGPVCSCEA